MKVALITAGAGGMYCGSCLRDNALARALNNLGQDVLLIPTYTPTTTDEENFSIGRVFYGGINVYLQEKTRVFRHTPWVADRLLDSPRLLRWVSRFAMSTDYGELSEMTLSVLQGEHGRQQKELEKLVTWLGEEVQPDLVNLPNIMFGALCEPIQRRLRVPVLCTLQGDDLFLDALEEPHKSRCLELAKEHAARMDGFVAPCKEYADFMSKYLDVPPGRIHVVYPGINLEGFGARHEKAKDDPVTIGYFARICPEKGLHVLVEAFQRLKKRPEGERCRLRVAGYLGERDRPYLEALEEGIEAEGLTDDYECLGTLSREEKIQFLQGLDVFSVPTTYHEPKGLFLLEAMACGVSAVQPLHGSFPELLERTGGGILVNPDRVADLVNGLVRLAGDASLRAELGRKGRTAIENQFTDRHMAEAMLHVYQTHLTRTA